MALLDLLVAMPGGEALGGLDGLQRFLSEVLGVHGCSHPLNAFIVLICKKAQIE